MTISLYWICGVWVTLAQRARAQELSSALLARPEHPAPIPLKSQYHDHVSGEIRYVEILRVRDEGAERRSDCVAVEAPLEVRLNGATFAVIMRTPGDDRELAAGFLFAERILLNPDDLGAIAHCSDPDASHPQNVITVTLTGASADALATTQAGPRRVVANSSCGVCGRQSIDDLAANCAPLQPMRALAPDVVTALPARLRERQVAFGQTGGLHAAGLFTIDGDLLDAAEDVGRHNAVDKVIGRLILKDALRPATRSWWSAAGRRSRSSRRPGSPASAASPRSRPPRASRSTSPPPPADPHRLRARRRLQRVRVVSLEPLEPVTNPHRHSLGVFWRMVNTTRPIMSNLAGVRAEPAGARHFTGASRRSSSKKLKMSVTCVGPAVAAVAGAITTRLPSGCRSKLAPTERPELDRRLAPDARLLGLKRVAGGRVRHHHDPSVGRQVEQLMPRARPDRVGAAARGDRRLAPWSRKRPDVDLEGARLVRFVGQPPPVRREARLLLRRTAHSETRSAFRASTRSPRRPRPAGSADRCPSAAEFRKTPGSDRSGATTPETVRSGWSSAASRPRCHPPAANRGSARRRPREEE